MATRVLTAYDLMSGQAIWLTPEGDWSAGIENARVGRSETDFEQMNSLAAAAVAANQIFDVYPVDVVEEVSGPRAVKYREHLRSRGPTVHPDFGRQAERRRPAE